MKTEYDYYRHKLPRHSGLALPIKKTEVDAALSQGEVAELESLFIGYKNRADAEDVIVIEAKLFGESSFGMYVEKLPSLTLYSVPKDFLYTIKEQIARDNWLERIIRWIKSLETASNVVRDIERSRALHFHNGNMYVLDESGKKVELP